MRSRARLVLAAVLLALGVCVAGPQRGEAWAESFADDGRVGVVTEVQGTALVRPAGRARWSPVGPRAVLLPGDDVRTLARGAHAAEIRLADGGSLVLGPGALTHLTSRGAVRLLAGDAEVTGAAGHAIAVTGPGGHASSVEKATVLRAVATADGPAAATRVLAEPPRWLTGYRGSTTDEWMGSLLAKVDGRNVPLTVGYHKVGVTIRDQIAETTVEESFVNSTDGTLEGVFSFPLPAGASISGFGMWIGGELVEADIVEKERARAIYEDIKARKKDPGLLEWSGGNLFTASVFPILPRGEKRIRLRYTQVLPLEGSVVRYRYALRSELLRTHPLRELKIAVSAQSTAPIVSVTSPTHEVRATKSDHEASVEFVASEFTPDRDFEVVLRLDAGSPLRVVPHRRGDDGYFMLMFAPPDAASGTAGGWKRELVPEGRPLDVLFLADTSGSMSPQDRRAQRAFVESALALLGPDDRFRLMACDADVVRLADEPLPPSDENVARAVEFLDGRYSLGWSDLDRAFEAAAAAAKEGTLVVYVGDGIVTTGDADPVAFAQRIARLQVPAGVSIHAVATGSTYEQGVLEALAARGGGSVRSAGDDPARAAFSLLSEVAALPVKDLKVAFEGIRTASVYPAKLPNLPAGTQQIVLGRFLPEGGEAQRGRVTLTGRIGAKVVSFAADLVLAPGAEGTGNTFLPRLWARRHLDALLAEGRSPAIKDEIVSMSEQYGIITPYTSFLVLENDEDRERYGVTRRVAMRDGERFFTEARTAAATTALRDQMRAARSWRLELRRSMLREIAGLGRGLAVSPPGGYAVGVLGQGGRGGFGGTGDAEGGWGAAPGSGEYQDSGLSVGRLVPSESQGPVNPDELYVPDASPGRAGEITDESDPSMEEGVFNPDPESVENLPSGATGGTSIGVGKLGHRSAGAPSGYASRRSGGGGRGGGGLGQRGYGESARRLASSVASIDGLFPPLLAPPANPPAAPPPAAWPQDVADVLALVSGPERLPTNSDARLEISWKDGQTAVAADDLWPSRTGRALVAPDRWHVRDRNAGWQPFEDWLAEDRGALATGVRLGRRREKSDTDRDAWAPLAGRGWVHFASAYPTWAARIVSREGSVAVVELTAPGDAKDALVVTIDTEKRLIVEQRSVHEGKTTGTWRRSGFVQAGGLWWATEETQSDGEGVVRARRTSTVREVAKPEFDAAFTAAMAGHDDVIFLGARDPSRLAAKQRIHEGRGTFADHLRVVADHVSRDRWDETFPAWAAARALVDLPAARKPGADWIEATLLVGSRRGERLAATLRELARSVASSGGSAAHGLARQVEGLAWNQLAPIERLRLLDVLATARDAASDAAETRWQASYWSRARAAVLLQSGRPSEATEIWRALWKERPDDPQRALWLMSALANGDEVDEALDLYRNVSPSLDAKADPRAAFPTQEFLSLLVRALGDVGRFDTVLEVVERWTVLQPTESQAWSARLRTLLALDRIDDFDRWIDPRVRATELPGTDQVARAKLAAAIQQAYGEEWNQFWNSPWHGASTDPKWVQPLADLARRLARDPKGDIGLASGIVARFSSRQNEAHRALLDGVRADLVAAGGIETPPPQALAQRLSWLAWDRTSVDAALWRSVTDRVEARWRTAPSDADRAALFRIVLRMLDTHGEPDEALRVLREEHGAAGAARQPDVARELLGRVAGMPWTQAVEDEAFALVPRIVTPESADAVDADKDARRAQFASAARWLSDRLVLSRTQAALPSPVEREKLPRAELRAKQQAASKDARRAIAARLLAESKTAPDLLRPWYEIERLGFAAQAGDDLAAVEAEAREMLLSVAAPAGLGTDDPAADEDDGDALPADRITWTIRERAVLVLSYLALRRDAPEGLADRVTALLRDRLEKEPKSLDWRQATFRLLVALDRPEEIEAALRAWIVPSKVESRWRRALGYVLAETGRLRDAAAQFEEIAALDELGDVEFAALADWYLVLGEDVRRESARERRLAQTDERTLHGRANQERWRVSSVGPDGVPPTMDDEVLRLLRVMLGKSSDPRNAAYAMAGLYETTKDFRVLAPLADGVVGHSPGATYGFLQAASGLLQQVHEEATCDEVRARTEARLASAVTDTDRRALALLLSLVERRAAEVLNQPGPHGARALAHLRSARKGTWLPGERRLMAELLMSFGQIPDAALAAEQVAQLKELHGEEAAGTADRLDVAEARFRTEWTYGRRDAAIDGLAAALDEFRQARGGVLPLETNDLADVLTGWQESVLHFGAGESWLAAEGARATSREQREWYARRTFQLWVRCLEKGGGVSLGRRDDLYRGARERMERALAEHSPDHLAEVLTLFVRLHHVAKVNGGAADIASARDDLLRFARKGLVPLLPRFGAYSANQVRTVAEEVQDLGGTVEALTLLVERLEQEPAWRTERGRGERAWIVFGWNLARWRRERPALGDLEPRLLAVVLRALERDLRSEDANGRYLYGDQDGGSYWREKTEEFATVARRVVEMNPDSPGRLLHVASYVRGALGRTEEAISVLESADRRGALREGGRAALVEWQQASNRWEASLPHAQRLMAERPDTLEYRVLAVRALHAVGQDGTGRVLVDETREHFAKLAGGAGRDARTTTELADLCVQCGYFDRAVVLLPEAISARRKLTRGGRGDEELSRLHAALARTLSGLGRHDEAVDAASSAVVAWGSGHEKRADALKVLRDVLAAMPDLAAWTAKWEKDAEAGGTDAPLVRTTLAAILLDRTEPDAALRHLLVARRHTPDDAAVHAAIAQAYAMKEDWAGLADALQTSLQSLPRQPDVLLRLANAFTRLDRAADAERARTGLAEYAPNEAEGHRQLAEERTLQGRHDDAVVQRQQVVRIRSKDPSGWLALATSLGCAGKKAEAHAVLDDVLRAPWGTDQRKEVEKVSGVIDGQ